MRKHKRAMVVAGALVLLAACGGGGGGGGGGDSVAAPGVTEAVPAEAGTSSASATKYLADLTAVAATRTELLEPVNLGSATLASDDTAEPTALR